METEDLIRQVRRIEIKTRGLSNDFFAGQYHSAFKGRGMSFAEVREYTYGDDVRDIDWNVTARWNRPYVKVFEEERELTVMLLVDVSGSLNFGTRRNTKRTVVTEIAATLSFSAIQNNDKIGVIFFSDKVEKYIPQRRAASTYSTSSESCWALNRSRRRRTCRLRWSISAVCRRGVARPLCSATSMTVRTLNALCRCAG